MLVSFVVQKIDAAWCCEASIAMVVLIVKEFLSVSIQRRG